VLVTTKKNKPVGILAQVLDFYLLINVQKEQIL
jgi:hypothetical protein